VAGGCRAIESFIAGVELVIETSPVKPRSAELLDAAVRRLAAARCAIDDDRASRLSAAYVVRGCTPRGQRSTRTAKPRTRTWTNSGERLSSPARATLI
jgi:hypothetical protein